MGCPDGKPSGARGPCCSGSASIPSASPAAIRTNYRAASGSALDKSVEAQVLNLLLDLKEEFGLTYIFISHDLEVVRFVSDRVMVMYLGKIAEIGPTETIFRGRRHPYTDALLGSMLSLDPDRRTTEAPLAGDPPNPINPPAGCRFHTRCRYAERVCASAQPALHIAGEEHQAACYRIIPGSGHSAAPAQGRRV
jgi:peptide/nickel transport system ATP-binding protein